MGNTNYRKGEFRCCSSLNDRTLRFETDCPTRQDQFTPPAKLRRILLRNPSVLHHNNKYTDVRKDVLIIFSLASLELMGYVEQTKKYETVHHVNKALRRRWAGGSPRQIPSTRPCFYTTVPTIYHTNDITQVHNSTHTPMTTGMTTGMTTPTNTPTYSDSSSNFLPPPSCCSFSIKNSANSESTFSSDLVAPKCDSFASLAWMRLTSA